jgi:phosphoribosylformimino-5-aminoimidazole carboxamide ribotide isomerase
MQLLGVIDLMAGRAVRARGGIRQQYAPVATIGGVAIDGDPLALARAYVDQFGLHTLYAADLDAIGGGEVRAAVIRGLAHIAPLWLDAGISTVERAQHAIGLGVTRAVVGLETLPSLEALSAICAAFGGAQVAFSLDLRGGEPVIGAGFVPPAGPLPALTSGCGAVGRGTRLTLSASEMAARAADAGATTLIVIDLARVGAATGPDFDLLSRVRSAAPGTLLLVGGGIRGVADLTRLSELGCDGALVASALHDGALRVSR